MRSEGRFWHERSLKTTIMLDFRFVCARLRANDQCVWLMGGWLRQEATNQPTANSTVCQLHFYDSWNSWSTYMTAGTAAQPLIISCGCNGCNAVEGTWNSLAARPWDPDKELATVDIIKVYPRRCSFSLPKVQNLGTTTTINSARLFCLNTRFFGEDARVLGWKYIYGVPASFGLMFLLTLAPGQPILLHFWAFTSCF